MLGCLQHRMLADEEEQKERHTAALPYQKEQRHLTTVVLMAACFGLGALCTLMATVPATAPVLQGPTVDTAAGPHSAAAPSSFPTGPHDPSFATAPAIALPAAAVRRCQDYLDRSFTHKFSLILTADSGEFSGVSEAHYILNNLEARQDTPRDRTVCGGASSGLLLGQPVLVVTTGIGPAAASLCTLEVLSHCGPLITEAIYFGTSGWSPLPGGLLNPPACSAANWRPNVTRTGDVCISPFSVNWMCKKSGWDMQTQGAPNQCVRPQESAGPQDTPLFGECQFYRDNIRANVRFANQLAGVARRSAATRNFPARTTNVTQHEKEYFSAVAEGAGQQPPALNPSSPPSIWNYRQCMEVDAQFFYSGAPWELKAREYAAETLTAALRHLRHLESEDQQGLGTLVPGREPEVVAAADIVAVAAMEGVGVSEALLRYHGLSTTREPIPFTNVRTLSNWIVQPLVQTQPGLWETLRQVPDDFVNGYAHAIATGSATIMSLYQDRCLAEGKARQGQKVGSKCAFVIEATDIVDRLLASGRDSRDRWARS